MRNFLKTIVSAVVLCSALMAAADIANAQAATDYGKRSSYMPEDATTVSQGANSDFGGMPYRGGWTRFQHADQAVAAAKPAPVAVAVAKAPVVQAPKYAANPPIRPGL